jgi:hypothetical protein
LADLKNDLHLYDPASVTWFNLSSHAHGFPPCARAEHGFAWVGGKLYVHGGRGTEGNKNILASASIEKDRPFVTTTILRRTELALASTRGFSFR